MKQTSTFVILVDLGYRIARVRTIAHNYAHALLKVYNRYVNKQTDFSKYNPLKPVLCH